MRAITQQSVNAFLNRENFKKANMSVTQSFGVTYLRLHNNIIAELYECGTIKITNAGWFSNTTKERLNGLPNVKIQQKAGEWFLNGELWNGDLIKIN